MKMMTKMLALATISFGLLAFGFASPATYEQWRKMKSNSKSYMYSQSNDKKCSIEGQVDMKCAPPYDTTCSNPIIDVCLDICTKRCACPPGTVLDPSKQKCINPSQCPMCSIDGQVYSTCAPPCDATCIDTNPECPMICTQRCVCPPGTVLDESIQKCVNASQCTPSCTIDGQVYSACAPSCDATCCNPNPECPSMMCTQRCVCPPGTVLDESAQKCVDASQCNEGPSESQGGAVIGQVYSTRASLCDATCCNLDPECPMIYTQRCVCPPGTVIDESTRKCVNASQCTPAASSTINGQVYSTCAPPCDATCCNLNPECPMICTKRCACPPGTVLDESTQKCVHALLCTTSSTTDGQDCSK